MAMTCDTQMYAKVAKKIRPATFPLEQELVVHATPPMSQLMFRARRDEERRTRRSDGVGDVDRDAGERVPDVPCGLDD